MLRSPGPRTRPLPLAAALATALSLPAAAQAPAPLEAVPFTDVRVADPFFAPRRATNVRVTLAHALDQLEAVGTLPNFDLAARGARAGYRGPVYQDSDAYKALEAVAYALAERRDPALEARLDAVIARMAAAQRPDGYLNTSYQVEDRGARFHNLRDDHELYCAGHLIEAAVAHFRATGKRNLLDVAVRFADLLVATFGEGGRRGYPGHPELELALVKLADVARDGRYLALAERLVQERGTGFFAEEHAQAGRGPDPAYWLDHCRVVDMDRLAGHAVRGAYLLAGATDVATRTGNAALLEASRRVWQGTVARNVFLTGGIGPSAANEGFTTDYDLPTSSAYQESCASIALVLWAHRLNLVTREAAYADAIETALYNAIPAGVQLDGTRFFYVNPLASRGDHHRREWFGCACCPPNLARTLAALGGYAYARAADALYVNLYLQGALTTELAAGPFALEVETDYPWDGAVALRVTRAPDAEVTLALRVPAWCEGATLLEPGADAPRAVAPGYAVVRRRFAAGDVVRLALPMPVRRLRADPRAEALRGRVAFARGPIVYCAEQADMAVPVAELLALPGAALAPEARPDLLGGVVVLRGELAHAAAEVWTDGALYRPAPAPEATAVTLVPYAVWDNRAPGAMAVWLPEAPPPPRVGGAELAAAAVELSFRHTNCFPEAARDGFVPERSADTPRENCHFWPHKGGREWAQYRWDAPRTLTAASVFWFDDTGRGECRLPASARLLYRDGETWRPVTLRDAEAFPVASDRWCEVRFAPVTTTALRLEVEQRDGFASGILEWRVR